MHRSSTGPSRFACTLAVVAVFLAAPVLGALAWSSTAALLSTRTPAPDRVVLALLALGGAVAAGYLCAGILVELTRGAARLAKMGRWAWSERVPAGPSPIARRLVAGALGAGLCSAVGLPAHAADDWDPGWQQAAAESITAEATAERATDPRATTATASLPATATSSSSNEVPSDSQGVASRQPDVVVRAGDSLWRIAEAHLSPAASRTQVAAAWPAWYAANRALVGADPNIIRPGQLLARPTTDPAGL